MKMPSVHSITAAGALGLAMPVGYFGIKTLATPSAPPSVAAVATATAHPIPKDDSEEKVEVYLPSGDSAAIHRAMKRLPASGGRIVLGAGVFPVYEPIVLDRDGVELKGSGKLTILQLADRAACPAVVIGSTSTPIPKTVSRVEVRNLVIDGNRSAQEPECWGGICDSGGLTFIRNNAITIRGAEEVKLEHVVVRNARSGGVVLEKRCQQIYIDDLEAHDNHFDGLACYETEDSYFSRLNLHDNRAAGISLDLRFNHNVIKSAHLHHNGSQGIFMRESNGNDFRKLKIHENGAQGVFIAQADAVTETSCTNNSFADLDVSNNRGHGLRVNDASCKENLVRNSRFDNNSEGNVSEVVEKLIALLNVSGL